MPTDRQPVDLDESPADEDILKYPGSVIFCRPQDFCGQGHGHGDGMADGVPRYGCRASVCETL